MLGRKHKKPIKWAQFTGPTRASPTQSLCNIREMHGRITGNINTFRQFTVTDDATIALLYATKFSTIFPYLTKLHIEPCNRRRHQSHTAKSAQNFSNSAYVWGYPPAEYLAADLARVWLYPRVQAHVPREHVAACKGALADVAVVGLGVGVPAPPGLVPGGHVLGQPDKEIKIN